MDSETIEGGARLRKVKGFPVLCRSIDLVRWTGIARSQLYEVMQRPDAPKQAKPRRWRTKEALSFVRLAAPMAGNNKNSDLMVEKLAAQIEEIKARTVLVKQKAAINDGKMVSREELYVALVKVAARQRSILSRILQEVTIKMKDMDFEQSREYLAQTGDEFFAEMQKLLEGPPVACN